MALNRNLSDQQFYHADRLFYHATSADLSPGQALLPRNIRSRSGFSGAGNLHPPGERWRDRRVWASKSPEDAAEWAGPNIYEVELIRPREPTYTEYDEGYGEQVHGKAGRVLRRVDPS